jgi:hypothetical protein
MWWRSWIVGEPRDVVPLSYFLLYSFKACSTYRFAAAGAARRKSTSASLPVAGAASRS